MFPPKPPTQAAVNPARWVGAIHTVEEEDETEAVRSGGFPPSSASIREEERVSGKLGPWCTAGREVGACLPPRDAVAVAAAVPSRVMTDCRRSACKGPHPLTVEASGEVFGMPKVAVPSCLLP